MYDDTVAAISTPLGESGIGIVRLSGSRALEIARRLFPYSLSDRRFVYGRLVDPFDGETIDEVLVSYMAAPHTYTREDVVEINCHGGPVPLQKVLEVVLREGARLAKPGEFTLRAFLNGRLDLAQAEAVLDVITARTAASLRVAMGGLAGRLSSKVAEVRQRVVEALAYLTATVDFPEDEIEEEDIRASLEEAACRLRELLKTAEAGMVYRQGVRTAIVGRPNVGKSSLLNRLLRRERAIVTPLPGTTRDTIEELLNLQGVPFLLTDTAGIAAGGSLVESLGIERSRATLEGADLALVMLDTSEPLQAEDREVLNLVGPRPCICVLNKIDLPPCLEEGLLPEPRARVSALTGAGLEELETLMVKAALGGRVVSSDEALVSNPRHKQALFRALVALESALSGLAEGLPPDLLCVELEAARCALGEITGEQASEELLESIFGRFCVGK